ncbi:hypothetical protein JTB14_033318 [Gonioctena quinquepunctata]|nr:hypothetical protein JTB14_033318 [Gonioctena quinquepunctata]
MLKHPYPHRWSDDKQLTPSLPPPEIEENHNETTLPPSDTCGSPETAQTVLDIEEREPTDAQEIGAHSLVVEDKIAATAPPLGLQEADVKFTGKICEIEAELSTTNTSSEDWAEEVDVSSECNISLDHDAPEVPKMLDTTFSDYSSDSDTDEIPRGPLRLLNTHDEQQENSPLPASKTDTLSQIPLVSQKDENGENLLAINETEQKSENTPSPENLEICDTFRATSDSIENVSKSETIIQQEVGNKGEILHTFSNSDLPHDQLPSSSQESGSFLDPPSNRV